MRLSERRPTYGKHAHPTYNQAQRIIDRFGGEKALAKILGIRRESIYKWSYAPPYGRDGLIPHHQVAVIQAAARREGILLTAEDWQPTKFPAPSTEEPTL